MCRKNVKLHDWHGGVARALSWKHIDELYGQFCKPNVITETRWLRSMQVDPMRRAVFNVLKRYVAIMSAYSQSSVLLCNPCKACIYYSNEKNSST